MPKIIVSVVLVLEITLCLTIRVPVDWNNDSEVINIEQLNNKNEETTEKNKPKEYFQYTAKKPQFAIDIASAHDVKAPEKHYTSYPIRPYTGVNKPELGKHHILDPDKNTFYPYQQYLNTNKDHSYVTPASTSYDVYHPYKEEEPALQEIYKDPVLEKIRNDLRDSKNRLQKYENDAGQSDINKDEYLETPEQTDHKHSMHRNRPAQFEIHRPMRRPVYYRPPPNYIHRDKILAQKLRHPWNQNYAKVTPMHYRPIKNHLHRLRQNHALKFDDEQNEYPQVLSHESYNERPDGYDIYERGRDKFMNLRNNVDESINKAVLNNRPATHQNLELKPNNKYKVINYEPNDDEFVPIKNYAQVRKTEIKKHLPKEAAFRDAESLDEIKNAPRLREAVKSTKAQIVYSEEGYEDSAYDHAGEQKHASDHEGHGGFLKENELSEGKYKTPSFNGSYDDAKGSIHGEKIVHGEKWTTDNKDNEDEIDSEDYYEKEQEISNGGDIYADTSNVENVTENNSQNDDEDDDEDYQNNNEEIESTVREKRQEFNNNSQVNDFEQQHKVNKREFKVPEINLNSTYFTDQIAKIRVLNKTDPKNNDDNIMLKYPYYFNKLSNVNSDSPLRYAENMKLIPKKSLGGTEFYDSRSDIICPVVEDDVDPVPEKLKQGENPNDNEEENSNTPKNEFKELKNKQRLKGLGDKIDCFKDKYFGENPLDSPFFKEELISSPEPVTKPNIEIFKTKQFENLHSLPNPELSNLKKTFDTNIFSSNSNSQPLIKLRKKRASPFMYEPYKIIRESQVPDTKKTTTTNNISPLIKQLQSSRVVDRVTINQNKDQIVKRNTNAKAYKDIDKLDRVKHQNNKSDDFQETDFIDISIDKRRGEPKYELQHSNHKTHYTPVENKKSISLEDYKDRIDSNSQIDTIPTSRPYFDVSKYIPTSVDTQNSAASNAVSKIVHASTTLPTKLEAEEKDSEDEYEEYDSDEDSENEEHTETTTTTTTTPPPRRRKPIRILKTTTNRPIESIDNLDNDTPKLRLTTRFRNTVHKAKPEEHKSNININPQLENNKNVERDSPPAYREKKKKITKSTLVTDTKTYGEDNDDMQKEDVDALIGIKHDTDDYMPEYEKRFNKKEHNGDENEDDEIDEDEDEDGDNSDESENYNEDEEDEEINKDKPGSYKGLTTSEPTKRTLPKTTQADVPTTEISKAKDQIKPTILRRKIEVHKESPINKLSPNVTQFKQDIKEVEIIKEMPPKIRQKNIKNAEILDFYKDENLAKDVNKLGGVEIFKEDFDIESEPRHGGNYRSIDAKDLLEEKNKSDDVDTSQTAVTNRVKTKGTVQPSRNTERRRISKPEERNAKIIELSDVTESSLRPMHGGNLKFSQRGRSNSENEKLTDQRNENSDAIPKRGRNLRSRRPTSSNRSMHGGNYKKLESDQPESSQESNYEDNKSSTIPKEDNSSAAALLSGYVRAAPILTTTPSYILDPSKRRYYYVDA